jgi:hypothetical protein
MEMIYFQNGLSPIMQYPNDIINNTYYSDYKSIYNYFFDKNKTYHYPIFDAGSNVIV